MEFILRKREWEERRICQGRMKKKKKKQYLSRGVIDPSLNWTPGHPYPARRRPWAKGTPPNKTLSRINCSGYLRMRTSPRTRWSSLTPPHRRKNWPLRPVPHLRSVFPWASRGGGPRGGLGGRWRGRRRTWRGRRGSWRRRRICWLPPRGRARRSYVGSRALGPDPALYWA